MDRAAVIKYWSVIEAFRNGKSIQVSEPSKNCWADTPYPAFNLEFDYRVKPEKKEMWVNVYRDAQGCVYHETKRDAEDRVGPGRIACVRVVYEEGEGL